VKTVVAEDILSQNEIDALLSAISSGDMDTESLKQEEEPKVKLYDFKRALRFSKDQIRSISRIYENYARLLTTFFSGQLRTYVNLTVASVDQVPYEEFIRSIPSMTVLNVFSVEPLEGRIIMEVNPNIAYSMLDRLLGGQGSNQVNLKNLTEIETIILSQLFEKSSNSLKTAWESMVDIEPILDELEVNPQFLQLVSPNETVVVVTLDTRIGEETGYINICIPHIVLEPIIPKLSVHYWMETGSKERNPEMYRRISKHLDDVQMDIEVHLGQTNINMLNLLQLQENDIITLNQSITDPLLLYVNGESKLSVQPGKFNNKIAVQVLDKLTHLRGENE